MLSEDERYLEFHEERYRLLLRCVAGSLSRCGAQCPDILVAGPSHEVRLVAERHPAARIDTLGIYDQRYPAPGGRHHEMDLNLSRDPAHWPAIGPYQLVILAEVIEHLQTSPQAVFKFLRGALRPGGELIVQTPNAASLAKRWNLLVGRNPFMPIPNAPGSSQHWREYTAGELIAAAGEAGLEPIGLSIDNCYRHQGMRARFYLRAGRLAPRALRDCITLTVARPSGPVPIVCR
ncbi:MAG: methyltransferase domain-containing protein [Bryobacterales bacterium]|nr:methyltransferase domain-containing protein [Bryobacterales bacterium]